MQAICDWVHNHITFDYQNARPTRTALDAYNERTGVCRDYTHLAMALCRCMNIPARYCTGYLGDIGMPPPYAMDFAAWMEVYLGGRWYILILGTICRASDEFLLREGATRPMSPLRPPSGRLFWRASGVDRRSQ